MDNEEIINLSRLAEFREGDPEPPETIVFRGGPSPFQPNRQVPDLVLVRDRSVDHLRYKANITFVDDE